jgi:predicted AAA+ superfamily ATPase
MYRVAIKQLIKWKLSSNRKPLIILGARQVGKTWLLKEFGNTEYKQMVYVNFEEERRMRDLFLADSHFPCRLQRRNLDDKLAAVCNRSNQLKINRITILLSRIGLYQ